MYAERDIQLQISGHPLDLTTHDFDLCICYERAHADTGRELCRMPVTVAPVATAQDLTDFIIE